jgi:hypothetical protein
VAGNTKVAADALQDSCRILGEFVRRPGPTNSVTSDSGLEGKKSNEAHCQFYRDDTQHLTA